MNEDSFAILWRKPIVNDLKLETVDAFRRENCKRLLAVGAL